MRMSARFKTLCKIVLGIAGVLCVLISVRTAMDVMPLRTSLRSLLSDAQIVQVTDRNGYPLTVSYQNRWNTYDNVPLSHIPDFLKTAFILSEDKRFYDHHGVDWRARMGALWQNVKSGHTVRGASTITEQVVRMIHPRPRTLWSKWIEGVEAWDLERHFSKADILEFYLNQVPYASNRRGVVQAANYYFDRDLSTLSHKEMLALVVLARAPSSFDLYKNASKIKRSINRLAGILAQQGYITSEEFTSLKSQEFMLGLPQPPVNAAHFVRYLRNHLMPAASHTMLRTTLDGKLQRKVQQILDERVKALQKKSLHNAAALVVDHTTGEILAWVVAGANNDSNIPSYQIDAVTIPRQPGSALKPFLYTLALEKGWTPVTMIKDSPFAEAIGSGLHHFRNYSNIYYGNITLREALANSLNIPALRTIGYVGKKHYLNILHKLGFESLDRGVDIYDEGLALGDGEVTLLELVQGYTALANRGIFRPLTLLMQQNSMDAPVQVFSEAATSLIGNILSDSWARRLEFGNNSVLNLPVQTAAKTGTSTDYRDAWAVGFNYRYVVGLWMGNLDHSPTNGVTGSTGPALALRSIFAELNQFEKTSPLFLSPQLVQQDVCIKTYDTSNACFFRTEYFMKGTETKNTNEVSRHLPVTLVSPTDGLQLAFDPRIPAAKQKFSFRVSGVEENAHVDWVVNGKSVAQTDGNEYLWPLQRGSYSAYAIVKKAGQIIRTEDIHFLVK